MFGFREIHEVKGYEKNLNTRTKVNTTDEDYLIGAGDRSVWKPEITLDDIERYEKDHRDYLIGAGDRGVWTPTTFVV